MTAKIWALIQKDMQAEYRAARAWPIMLLMGTVVALILGFQLDRLTGERMELVGGIFWLAVFFAGTVAMEHSFASEREDGCWETLRSYPLSPSAVFIAKLTANCLALSLLHFGFSRADTTSRFRPSNTEALMAKVTSQSPMWAQPRNHVTSPAAPNSKPPQIANETINWNPARSNSTGIVARVRLSITDVS